MPPIDRVGPGSHLQMACEISLTLLTQMGSPVTMPTLRGRALPTDYGVDGRAEQCALLDESISGLVMTRPRNIL